MGLATHERWQRPELEEVELELAMVLDGGADDPRRRRLDRRHLRREQPHHVREAVDALKIARLVNVLHELLQVEQRTLARVVGERDVERHRERLAH